MHCPSGKKQNGEKVEAKTLRYSRQVHAVLKLDVVCLLINTVISRSCSSDRDTTLTKAINALKNPYRLDRLDVNHK